MDISQAFPSNYIKASDLAGQSVSVVLLNCQMESFDDGDRPVLFFQGRQKGLVLNKTNATVLADAFGSETDQWAGHPIELYSAQTSYMGKPCEGVRVRVPNAATTFNAVQPQPQPTTPTF